MYWRSPGARYVMIWAVVALGMLGCDEGLVEPIATEFESDQTMILAGGGFCGLNVYPYAPSMCPASKPELVLDFGSDGCDACCTEDCSECPQDASGYYTWCSSCTAICVMAWDQPGYCESTEWHDFTWGLDQCYTMPPVCERQWECDGGCQETTCDDELWGSLSVMCVEEVPSGIEDPVCGKVCPGLELLHLRTCECNAKGTGCSSDSQQLLCAGEL